MNARLIAFVVVALAVGPSRATPLATSTIDTRAIVEKLMKQLTPTGPRMDPAAARKQLVDLRAQAKTPRERALLDKMIALIEQLNGQLEGDGDLDAMIARFREILVELGALAPDDIDVQVSVTSGLDRLAFMTGRGEDDPIAKEVRRRWDELAAQFPKSARVHAGRGFAGERIGLSKLETARELGRCIELGEGKLKQSCADLLARDAVAYEKPFCPTADVDRRFRVVAEADHGRAVQLDGRKLEVGDETVLDAGDVVEVRRETMHVTSTDPSGARSERDEERCGIDLAPAALPRIRKTSERLRNGGVSVEDGWRASRMVVLVGDKALAEVDTAFMAKVPGSLSLSSGPRVDCFQICARSQRRVLPAELRALLSQP